MSELKITSLGELNEYGFGSVVQLPDFAEGRPFVARLGRPSILDLATSGQIPNGLLTTANELFAGKGVNPKNPAALSELKKLIDVLCTACFLEPTYAEIQSSGVKLTDEQMMFVFQYTQRGVKALEPFRKE